MTTTEAVVCGPHPSAFASSSVNTPEPGPSSRPEGPSHPCPFEGCIKSYAKASKLAQHVRSHTGERPFVCDHPGCGASYMRNEHLKAHQRRHQDASEKPFACDQEGCGLRFWTSSQLKNHVQACHADHVSSATGASAHDYACTEAGCEMTFHKRKQLRQHIRDHHSSPAAPADRVHAGARQEPEAVSASHSKALPFACQYPGCNKRFPTNSKRKTHFRTHEDGRYTCSMDHTQPQQATIHDQGPFIYTFPTWSALQAHMKEAHPPICPWPGCGKQFQRQDNLRAHYRRHEERRLRLEMEAKVLEGGRENELNQLRAELSDDSYASMSEEEEEQDQRDHFVGPAAEGITTTTPGAHLSTGHGLQQQEIRSLTRNGSPSLTPVQTPALTEEQLIRKAAQLHSKRPRRGGVFRDLGSPALSIITSTSGRTGSPRLGSIATSITSARGVATAFPCTWNGCSKVFTRKSTLSIHVRTAHLGERPFECPDCGRRFAHKHLVSRHRRTCKGARSPSEQAAGSGSRLRFSTAGQHEQGDTEDDSDKEGSDSEQESHSGSASSTGSGDDSKHKTSAPHLHTAESAPSVFKPRLLDLLTGQGYSTDPQMPAPGKRQAVDASESVAKKRRTTRDRIFGCPWSNICSALDHQTPDTAPARTDDANVSDVASEPQLDGHVKSNPACELRFKRLYDLRRHLRSQHGLDLTTEELSAITHQTAWANVQ